ncbi:MAG TPA: capsule biosynthesis protein [Polyangia bacterium]
MELRNQLWRMKRLLRTIVPPKVPQVDWKATLGKDFEEWRRIQASLPANAPKVLLAPAVGTPGIVTLDSLLAVALTLRGARVHVLLCDEILPACINSLLDRIKDQKEFLDHGPQRWLCGTCHRSGDQMLSSLGLTVHHLSDSLTAQERAEAKRLSQTLPASEIPAYKLDGLNVGEHALAGAIRFFARGSLEREEYGEGVLRRYFEASLLTAWALDRLIDREGFDVASFHHGIYIPQGVIGEVARKKGVRVVNWARAYRKNSFIFSHGDTYHHTLMTEPAEDWGSVEWSKETEQELLAYLQSRWNGARDWISFNRSPEADREVIKQQIGIDFSKPTIGLLTNVMWDAQLHYPQNAFPNMLEWLLDTIRYFKERPDLQLLIRIHPAEIQGEIKSRQPVLSELKSAFPDWPSNVFVIPPESSISTYAAMMECDSVLIYGTKTGVELTSLGIPVIVAGEAWIRNKGLTKDVVARGQYRQILDELPLRKRMSAEAMQNARKYAYHFFFRRMIPLRVIAAVPPPSWMTFTVAIKSLDELRPGRDPGLDVICNGILAGAPFIYPAEREPWPDAGGKHGFSAIAQ